MNKHKHMSENIENHLDCDKNENIYDIECNKRLLLSENLNRKELLKHPNDFPYLYPNLNDSLFNIKIAQKKEFSDTRYDGKIYDVKEYAEVLSHAEYELLPQQAFVRNYMSFQTPYNSLLLFHGLGSGKTCSAIGVCEEMRDYLKQMGISKRIIIVASPNVQDNFKLQLFDERKLKKVDGIWTMKGCLGNKLLKEINQTSMNELSKDKIISQVKSLINASYSFTGYTQFSNDIVRKAGNNVETKIDNLQEAYSDRLIIIDEVHNIRISDDNDNKEVAKNLMFLVNSVSNIRLLLLSATPMFNSYKEIIWLLNLMNMNDRRGIISIKDVFDKDGDLKKDGNGYEIGRDILMRKATGYVSYVRGENPYTFPFRVYPNRFAPKYTFLNESEYPKYQLNGKRIPRELIIKKQSLYLTKAGDIQQMGYDYIIDRLLSREGTTIITKKGQSRRVASFKQLKSFGYTDLQLPLESLIIVYPYEYLDEIAKGIVHIEHSNELEDKGVEITPQLDIEDEDDNVKVIDDVLSNGPTLIRKISKEKEEKEEEEKKEEAPISSLIINDDDDDIISIKSVIPTSFTETLVEHEHIIEGKTISDNETLKNDINSMSSLQGGAKDKKIKAKVYIEPSELTGSGGLKRTMIYLDSKTPPVKGSFEYKPDTSHIFAPNEIGRYSSKIKNVCESIYNSQTNKASDGIILIYSSYIDGGLIPMALALEEMGFMRHGGKSLFKKPPCQVVDVETMLAPTTKKFNPAKYVMITGDTRLSPHNNAAVKSLTDDDNFDGSKIKVVLISQAGSEGLDFKAIRQIHILEPWYNVNRIEQIIGRGVRNFSHKDLPFEERNVQIFLYGTILNNVEEESADLYVYRMSELKAVKIGNITRILKQNAVDCNINHDQTLLTTENFKEHEKNKNIIQILSDHTKLEHFEIGDLNYSSTCDYMQCEFKCLPDEEYNEQLLNNDTYNETFMLINSDKIMQKIRTLMRMKFFYKKNELFSLINQPKKYPTVHIYSALTQMINDNAEHIFDKYGRTGYLINIGEYYLFQPSELNFNNISIYDRSVPLDYKHGSINLELNPEFREREKLINKPKNNITDRFSEGKEILATMYDNYKLGRDTTSVKRGVDNWYEHCGVVIRKMNENNITLEYLETLLIEHIVDCLLMNEKINVMNYMNNNNYLFDNNSDKTNIDFLTKVKLYFNSKVIVVKNITGIVLFNGSSSIDNLHIYILNNNEWVLGESEDYNDLEPIISSKYALNNKEDLNKYIGFIGFDSHDSMIYKTKDIENARSTGARCDQSGKLNNIKKLQQIDPNIKNEDVNKLGGLYELCVRQELTLRLFEKTNHENKTWFVNTETEIINKFEKK